MCSLVVADGDIRARAADHAGAIERASDRVRARSRQAARVVHLLERQVRSYIYIYRSIFVFSSITIGGTCYLCVAFRSKAIEKIIYSTSSGSVVVNDVFMQVLFFIVGYELS